MNSAPTMARSAGRNVRWVAVGQAGRIGLQVLTLLLLSRLLPPADFGLVALVTAVCNFALLWRDLGTATALVREAELRDAMVNTVFWLNAAIGFVVAAVVWLAREPLAAALGDARVAPLLAVVACSFPLQGLGAAQQALLERAGRFRALAVIEIAAGALGLGIAVAGGLAGWGALSLVLQTVATAGVATVLLWWRSGWRPSGGWQAGELRALVPFSGHLTAFNLVNYVTRNADSLIIGRMLGAGVLGAYSLAMRVTLFPVQNLTWAASRALLPVMNRPGQAAGELAALYRRSLALIALLSAPLMAGLFALREDFVAVVLGPQWPLAAALLAWLAPVGFVQSIVSTVGPVFLARGRSDILLRMGMVSLVVIVGALLVGVRFGPLAVAAAYLVANLLQALPFLLLALRQLGLGPAVLARALAAPAAGAVALLAVIGGVQALGLLGAWPALPRLLLLSVAGALAYACVVWVAGRETCIDTLKLLRLRP